MGCDWVGVDVGGGGDEFQFTHPVWGATAEQIQSDKDIAVSIHAPRVGCDVTTPPEQSKEQEFQFTHPVWGATKKYIGNVMYVNVSIHAPRVGCDEDLV